jgi:hypothetical protein
MDWVARARDFSLLHRVWPGSGAHPASYLMGTWGSFPGIKRSGCGADHAPPSSDEVKNGVAIPPCPPVCLYGVVPNELSTGATLPFYLMQLWSRP